MRGEVLAVATPTYIIIQDERYSIVDLYAYSKYAINQEKFRKKGLSSWLMVAVKIKHMKTHAPYCYQCGNIKIILIKFSQIFGMYS